MNKAILNLQNNIAKLKNGDLHYAKTGTGKAMVLIHGFGGSRHDWSENIKSLSQSHTLYIIDLSGFGSSPPPNNQVEKFTDYYTEILDQFRQFIGEEKIILVGNSMGGGIALKYALEYPSQVKSIIIANAAGLGIATHIGYRVLSIPWVLKIGLSLTHPITLNLIWKEMVFDNRIALTERAKITYAWVSKIETKRFLSKFFPITISLKGQLGIITDLLKELELPICIVWGKEDKILPYHHAMVAKHQIKNVALFPLENCGHMPHIEHPNKFNKIILSFLNSK